MSRRAREMVARVERAWMDTTIGPPVRDRLVACAGDVMVTRSATFADEHHPAFTHPLRTALLLLEAGEEDARAHEAALLFDSEEPALVGTLPPRMDDVAALADAGPDARLELLVTADAWLLHAWLAERLDHIRHLHLWAGSDRTRRALERAEREELPLADRVGGRLERAWSDWMEKARRYRLADRAEMRPIGCDDQT